MKVTGCFVCVESDEALSDRPNEYYKPCVVCNTMMNLGTTLLGYTTTPNGHPAIATKRNAPSLYPTGNWLVLEPGVAEKLLTDEAAEQMITSERNLVEDSLVTGIRELAGHDYTLISDKDADKIHAAVEDIRNKTGGEKDESRH